MEVYTILYGAVRGRCRSCSWLLFLDCRNNSRVEISIEESKMNIADMLIPYPISYPIGYPATSRD